MNKRRVTIFLEDTTYKLLRIMAAEDGSSMTKVIEDFITGERQNIKTDEKGTHVEGYELDEKRAVTYAPDDPLFTEGVEEKELTYEKYEAA